MKNYLPTFSTPEKPKTFGRFFHTAIFAFIVLVPGLVCKGKLPQNPPPAAAEGGAQMKRLLFTFAVALAFMAGAWAEPPITSFGTKDYDKPWIGAELLFKRYDDNPIAADARYRYKALTVIGTVEDIGRDILGNPYLVLRGDGDFGGVQCTFGIEAEPEIAKISKGHSVAIYGEITGLVFFNVQVGDCKFTALPIRIKKAIAAK